MHREVAEAWRGAPVVLTCGRVDASGYQVAYDITQAPPDWQFPAFGLIFVGLGLLMLLFRERMLWAWRWPMSTSPKARTIFSLLFLGFSILWTTTTAFMIFGSHFAAQRALRDGSADVVEGRVEEFHPMPYRGHDTERFVVGGVHFAYSDYVVGEGFNRTSSHGGPIRSGLYVRIHYSGSKDRAKILKLETAADRSL